MRITSLEGVRACVCMFVALACVRVCGAHAKLRAYEQDKQLVNIIMCVRFLRFTIYVEFGHVFINCSKYNVIPMNTLLGITLIK